MYIYKCTKEKSNIEIMSKKAQILDLLEKEFELAPLNLFKKLKKIMCNELKVRMGMMSHYVQNIN
jgi:hypothetical protein